MIIDRIERAQRYYGLNEGIERAFRYLAATDLYALAPGRYAIDGERMFVIVEQYQTKPREQGRWEAPRRYIDVQVILAGVEVMGYAPVEDLQVTEAYDAARDIKWFSGSGDWLTVPSGAFVVFFPEDGHMPGLATDAPATVRKVVVKIACA